MLQIIISGETLAEIAFNAARLAEELTAQHQTDAATPGADTAETQKAHAAKDEKLPEETKKEEKKTTTRGNRKSTTSTADKKEEPKEDPKPEKATRTSRRSVQKPAEETAEQKEKRAQINLDFEDLGSLAQTNTAVRDDVQELLDRNGLKTAADVTTDQLDTVAADLAVLIDRYFEAA